MATVSKNNPDARKSTGSMKFATSSDCEVCKDQCQKGKNYLQIFSKRGTGNGVPCEKK
jgi:hypothetical protein